MITQIIEFATSLSEAEAMAVAKERADQFRALPGLNGSITSLSFLRVSRRLRRTRASIQSSMLIREAVVSDAHDLARAHVDTPGAIPIAASCLMRS